jgi:hypothetical protein
MNEHYESRETGFAGYLIAIILIILLCSCSEYVDFNQEIKPDSVAHPDTTNRHLKEVKQ